MQGPVPSCVPTFTIQHLSISKYQNGKKEPTARVFLLRTTLLATAVLIRINIAAMIAAPFSLVRLIIVSLFDRSGRGGWGAGLHPYLFS